MRNRANQERKAAAAVELAVLLPLLMFLFVIAVDFGRIFYYSQVIENCARQGASWASDEKSPSQNLYADVTSAALADAPNLSPAPTATETFGTDQDGNQCVTVTVTWTFQSITNFPGVPSSVTLTRSVQMRVAP
jgi:Flp pilus assembly protein TadG